MKTNRKTRRARACFGAGFGTRLSRVAVAGALLALGACSETLVVRGNLPDAEMVSEIQTGVHSRQDVADLIGSPSTLSTFQDRTWYYIGHKETQFAFLKPEVVERSILVVSFDPAGVVDRTKIYTLDDGKVIDPVSRKTPTEGRELSLLQQLLGNLGRFPTQADQGARTRAPGQ